MVVWLVRVALAIYALRTVLCSNDTLLLSLLHE